MSTDTSVATSVEGSYWQRVEGARDDSERPTMYRTASRPSRRIIWTETSLVLRSRSPGLEGRHEGERREGHTQGSGLVSSDWAGTCQEFGSIPD